MVKYSVVFEGFYLLCSCWSSHALRNICKMKKLIGLVFLFFATVCFTQVKTFYSNGYEDILREKC
jgi:hypothetical protein